MAEMAMEPWGCPWCGEDADITNKGCPDYMRAVLEYEAWLEEHVTECGPWLAEQQGK